MKIAIYGQFYHKNSGGYIASVLNALDKAKADVYIEANFLELIQANESIEKDYQGFETFSSLDDSFDLFFSIGGDGTILRSITYVKDLNIPIVGINTGRLGFLATIQKDDLKEHIDHILNGEYSISERSLLQVKTTPATAMEGVLNFALNHYFLWKILSFWMMLKRIRTNLMMNELGFHLPIRVLVSFG